jgi:hypothetical protein
LARASDIDSPCKTPLVIASARLGFPPVDGAKWVYIQEMSDQRKDWFAKVVESGLHNQIFNPADVLAHATPDVLASHLPPDLLSKVLAASLAAGAMTPERVLETVTPELLAQHLPHEVLWSCIAAAAARAGVTNVVVS